PENTACLWRDFDGRGPEGILGHQSNTSINFLPGFKFANSNLDVNDQVSSIANNTSDCLRVALNFDARGLFSTEVEPRSSGNVVFPFNDDISWVTFIRC